MNELQKIYDSEINFKISTFWDGGFDIALGDELNGIEAKTTVDVADDIVPWLKENFLEHFPNSEYAKDLKLRMTIHEPSPCCDSVTGLRKKKRICLRCEKPIILINQP